MTALAFYLLSDLGPDLTAILKTFGAGALIAMAAETMIPEAFHNGPSIPAFLPLRASQPSSYSAKSPSEPSVWICAASAATGSGSCRLRTAEVGSVFEAYPRRSGNIMALAGCW